MILETFESYNDILLLDKRIRDFLSKDIDNEKNIVEQIVGQYKINDIVKVSDLKTLKGLFENNDVILQIKLSSDDEVHGKAIMGSGGYYIIIYLNSESTHALNKFPSNSLYFLLSRVFLHEFQHIFDFYRSKGKAADKTTYDLDKIMDNDVEEYKKYIRDDMEVSAKMVEILNGISFSTFDEDFNIVPRSLKEVLNEFKDKFKNFRLLKEKQKRKLLSKVSQYYYKEIDKRKNEK